MRDYRILILCALVLGSCTQPDLYPNEHFYNQRAYPDNFINREVIKRTTLEVREKMTAKASPGTWNLEGPINIGGRITDLAISPANDDHFYLCTAVGGVFRSYDRGVSWQPIFDGQEKYSIGNIAIAPSDASRIYVGTGEANGSATSGAFFGDGVYRSDDGGDSWTNIGLDGTDHTSRIVVDPSDPDRLFVATTGVLYGKNFERGVYRSEDGGANWDHVLFVSDSTACIDLVMNPLNPDTLFASMWERIRYPWQRDYGGPTSGVYRSTNGGDSWQLLTGGLPVSGSETGRIGLAISESNPNVVYASYAYNSITNEFDAMYRSIDNGSTWTEITGGQLAGSYATFGWYFGNVRVNPNNPDDVIMLGQTLWRTQDAGANWFQVSGMHVDHHGMQFSKTDPDLVLAGNDGGAYISEDGGNSWSHFDNLPITQFYNIEVDEQLPQRVFGGTQDNNTLRTLTGSTNDWHAILGGDGFHVIVDPTNSDLVYAEYQWGNFFRSVDGGDNMIQAMDGIDVNDRTNWNTPVVISPFDPDVLFYGANRLYQSFDNAQWWDPISPDLTGGQHPSGSLSYGTLTTIAPSHNNLDVIYTGSDDGNVNVTVDGGGNWQTVNTGLPNRYVSQIAIHPNHDATAYAVFSGFGYLDYTPHIFKTVDYGQNWVSISGSLPDMPLNSIQLWPEENLIFVAGDMGVWYSADDGLTWDVLGNNLPMTIVANLRLHKPTSTLYAGTFGRSIHSFDLTQLPLVGLGSVKNESHFNLYPNPSNGLITVEMMGEISATQIQIVGSNGQLVHSQAISAAGHIKQTLDLSHLAKGSYTAVMIGNDRTFSRSFLLTE